MGVHVIYCIMLLRNLVKCLAVYYWFDKSTKRKNTLQSYCTFCDQEYRSMIKHISTRWLSLHRAVERSLMQFAALRSYFLSSSESQARFKRLQEAFEDPMTEVYLMFFHSVLPLFTGTRARARASASSFVLSEPTPVFFFG